jgi:hypothetical protein
MKDLVNAPYIEKATLIKCVGRIKKLPAIVAGSFITHYFLGFNPNIQAKGA